MQERDTQQRLKRGEQDKKALIQKGFSDEQVANLRLVRAHARRNPDQAQPRSGFTRREMNRLVFLKQEINRGRIQR